MKNFLKFLLVLIVITIASWYATSWHLSDQEESQINGGKAFYPEHTTYFYVNDYSKVLTEETEKFIVKEAKKLNMLTKAQVVVTTIPNTGLNTLENYSLTIANKWGIGDKEKNNGILILFTTDKPHVRLEVGKGLEGDIPDGKAGRILDDYAVEAKNNRKWNKAALNTFVAVMQLLYQKYSFDVPETLKLFNDDVDQQINNTVRTIADANFEQIQKEEIISFSNGIFTLYYIMYYVLFSLISFIGYAIIADEPTSGRSHYSGSGSYHSSHSSSRSYSSRSSGGSRGGGGSFGGGGASR